MLKSGSMQRPWRSKKLYSIYMVSDGQSCFVLNTGTHLYSWYLTRCMAGILTILRTIFVSSSTLIPHGPQAMAHTRRLPMTLFQNHRQESSLKLCRLLGMANRLSRDKLNKLIFTFFAKIGLCGEQGPSYSCGELWRSSMFVQLLFYLSFISKKTTG